MRLNKYLLMVAVFLLPFVVISFAFRSKTNFNFEKNSKNDESNEEVISYEIKMLSDGEIYTLDLEDYVIGVVAGEMPASFMEEALKAQAVVSRTYALYRKSASNETYDISNGTGAQVYLSDEEMHEKWGEDYQKYYDKIKKAVMDTKGKVITYGGDLIEALYFAMSSGSTNDSKSVFGEERSYLQSVVSKYDNDTLEGFQKEVHLTKKDFIKKLGLSCEDITIDYVNKNNSGYVEDISICNTSYKGTEVRSKLGLRSSNFVIDVKEDIAIYTKGYGHGVGMSQYGANGYANNGYTYEDIIKHYYSGVEINSLKDV